MECKIFKTIKALTYANGLRKSKPTPKVKPYPEGYFMTKEFDESPLRKPLSDVCEFSNKKNTSAFKNIIQKCFKFILGK